MNERPSYHDSDFERAMRGASLGESDRSAVEAFGNFLSWGEVPALPSTARVKRVYRSVPPAWWAYTFGDTRWCPAKGEL